MSCQQFKAITCVECFSDHVLLQCPHQTCTLYEVGDLCTSQCSSCGTLCESFPITDGSSAALYAIKGCTVIVGDLYIINLGPTITRTALLGYLKNVKEIRGYLHFKDNADLSAMTFLSNLVRLYGAVYSNNPALIDTRMFSLSSLPYGVTVVGCDRLCPARYTTTAGTVTDDSQCTNPQLEYFLNIAGSAVASDLELLNAVMQRVVRNVTNGVVCVYYDLHFRYSSCHYVAYHNLC